MVRKMIDVLCVRSVDIFAIYPKILGEILASEEEYRGARIGPHGRIIQLPSDFEWKQKVYFRLLDKQRLINAAIERGEPLEEIKPQKPQWDPNFAYENIEQITAKATGKRIFKQRIQRCLSDDPIGYLTEQQINLWDLEDIAKAGKLLSKPPIPCSFADEQEMRCVYSLIYDVFRFKIVLNQSLSDVAFFDNYPELTTEITRVWLLLFDLNQRHFTKRDPEETIKKNILFKEANLLYIESCLWKHRVKLAASVSRLRIRNHALNLSKLLPVHLQDEKVAIAAANPIVSGWVNSFKKFNSSNAKDTLEQMNFKETEEIGQFVNPLKTSFYKFDKLCPQFLTCIPIDRLEFSQSKLIKNHDFIVQDRTFALGPAIFSRLLDHFELDGNVIQTHVASPKSTAYLASLFLSNNRVEKFIAFGAGHRLKEYNEYLNTLNVNNVIIYADDFIDLPINSIHFDKVVGVFATPPNSYSGVSDPIDLICSRGGDLGMLEVMTESDISDDAKTRVAEVLKEQRDTLRLAMSRPQVQFILYETHSVIEAENEKMVECAIESINRAAKAKHIAAEKERLRQAALAAAESYPVPFQAQSAQTPRKKEESLSKTKSPRDEDKTSPRLDESGLPLEKSDDETEEDEFGHIDAPLTDYFETSDIPDICLNQDNCLNFKNRGCYFALLKRKEVTCLDAKYMIKMAEARGVFGNVGQKKGKPKTAKKIEKKDEKKEEEERQNAKRLKRKKSDLQLIIDRLSQPTHSFLTKIGKQRRSSAEYKMLVIDPATNCICCRHHNHHHQEYFDASLLITPRYEMVRAKKWWIETAKFMQSLRLLNGREKNAPFDLEKINDDVINERIKPLRLLRKINHSDRRPKSQPADREPFPLSVSALEFHNCEKYNHCPILDELDLHRPLSSVNRRSRKKSSRISRRGSTQRSSL